MTIKVKHDKVKAFVYTKAILLQYFNSCHEYYALKKKFL